MLLGFHDSNFPKVWSLQETQGGSIYAEILAMEEAVLERMHQLMAGQSPQARREVELTNVRGL